MIDIDENREEKRILEALVIKTNGHLGKWQRPS